MEINQQYCFMLTGYSKQRPKKPLLDIEKNACSYKHAEKKALKQKLNYIKTFFYTDKLFHPIF